MKTEFLLLSLLSAVLLLLSPAYAADNGDAEFKPNPPATDTKGAEQPRDLFDFEASGKGEASDAGGLVLDERILIKVEPVVRSPVVDRVVEPAKIMARAPGFSRVEFFIEPVDAPFGGKSLGEPKLLGQSKNPGNFALRWNAPESHEYVKIFVLAYRTDGSSMGRSRAIDLGIGGNRLQVVPDVPRGLSSPQ